MAAQALYAYCQRTDHALPIQLTKPRTELDRYRQPADPRLREAGRARPTGSNRPEADTWVTGF